MSLEDGGVLFKNVVDIHARPPSDASEEDDKIGVTEGLFLVIGIVDFDIGDVGIATILKF